MCVCVCVCVNLAYKVEWKLSSKQVYVFSQPRKLNHDDIVVTSSHPIALVRKQFALQGDVPVEKGDNKSCRMTV